MFTEKEATELIEKQRSCWPEYDERIKQLESVQTKQFSIGNCKIIAQHNPARVVSTGAKVDKQSIKERKCFLCAENRPSQQIGLEILPNYTLLVNPFPILKGHYTIVCNKHSEQKIYDRLPDMLKMAELMPNHMFLYNGPCCGASAPDHMHFQAVLKGQMPFEEECKTLPNITLSDNRDGQMIAIQGLGRKCIILQSHRIDMVTSFFHQMFHQLPKNGNEEPMMNLFACKEGDTFKLFLFSRKAHRPSQYFSEGDNWMISPGAIDMGGVLVLPRCEDFNRINEAIIADVYSQVSL